MSIFKFLNKKNKQEVKKLTTLEQVRKAYEDLSEDDKKSFHQSISDRVHESIAAQERDDGNKDSQSAAAREHEALGAEHAEGRGDVSELHMQDRDESKEQDRADEGKTDVKEEADSWRKQVDERFSKIEATLEKMSTESKLDRAAGKYGMHPQSAGHETNKQFTAADVAKIKF